VCFANNQWSAALKLLLGPIQCFFVSFVYPAAPLQLLPLAGRETRSPNNLHDIHSR
jgi:hypothetical protein